MTAAPVGDKIRIDRVYRKRGLVARCKEPWHALKCNKEASAPWPLDGATVKELEPKVVSKMVFLSLERLWPQEARVQEPIFWRPVLRGARADRFEDYFHPPAQPFPLQHDICREIHCDGLIELGYISCNKLDDDLWINPCDLMVMFANLMCGADRVRSQSLAPLAEYAVEVQIDVKGSALIPDVDGRLRTLSPAAKSHLTGDAMAPGVERFPRYSLGSPDEFNLLLNMFHRDFWHAFGSDFDIEKNELVIEGWPDQASSEEL